MKRYFVMVLALCLAIAMVVALPGCGGDTGKAKEYINNAYKLIEDIEANSDEMEEQFDTIFTELAGGEVTSSAKAEELADGLTDATEKSLKTASEAKAELEKVASLEGVEDYKEYALLRISVIDGIIELIEQTEKYLKDLAEILTAAEAGQPVDLAKVESDSMAFFTKVQELQESVKESGEAADALQDKL
ncbi:MAG: hypothetical protein L6427_09795 [Actinomycetia bacterium]|nr:hypothetical protein [Actinomycetota bacterium]MCG2796135.1 hypothetical protein [Actinomycetes bacterium]